MNQGNTAKKSWGVWATLCAAVLALAAGIYFVVIHGTFGLDSTHNGVCYDPLVTALLIGGAAVAVCLVLLKKSGLAAALVVGEVALYARKTRKAAK